MKKYNIQNYTIYKKDLELSMPEGLFWEDYTRDELIIKFMPLVENLARKFATSYQAIGILSINDLIQFGNVALVIAVDKIDWYKLKESQSMEQTLKSFLSKRIKGGIRRQIDMKMSDIQIPDWKLSEMRVEADKDKSKDKDILLSESKPTYINDLGKYSDDDIDIIEIMDKHQEYSLHILSGYILACVKKYLPPVEQEVVRLAYGLNCPKHTAVDICAVIGIEGSYKTKNTRISEIRRRALKTLSENINRSQIVDLL